MINEPNKKFFRPPPALPSNNPYEKFKGAFTADGGIPDDYTIPDEIIDVANNLKSKNPEFAKIYQDEALIYILTNDAKWFKEKFTGERDENGCLIEINGNVSWSKPLGCTATGLRIIAKIALQKFRIRYGDEVTLKYTQEEIKDSIISALENDTEQ